MRLGIRRLTASSKPVFDVLLAARTAAMSHDKLPPANAIVRPHAPTSIAGRIAIPVPVGTTGASAAMFDATPEPAAYLFDGELPGHLETVAVEVAARPSKLAEGTVPIAKPTIAAATAPEPAEPWCAPTREVDSARLRELVRQTRPPDGANDDPGPSLVASRRRAVMVIAALVIALASAIAFGIACS